MSTYEESIEELLATDSFVRWIENRASQQEAEEWATWVDNDPARKQLVKKAKMLHQNIAFRKERYPETESELRTLWQTIQEHKSASKTKFYQLHRRTSYISAAAIIVLLVAVLSVIGYVSPNTYSNLQTVEESQKQFTTNSTTDGEKKILTLSDGSKITLNANSSVRYPANYSGGDLEVWLEGEAFFEVAHKTGDKARTLSVNVPEGSIRVLGTKFNVNTYEDVTEVVLIEGRVNVEKQNADGNTTESQILEPGQMSRIPQLDKQITVSTVNSELYTSWTEDKLIFDETPLQQVIKRVEHLYDVQFELNHQALENTPISGSLPNNNVEVFLKALENILEKPVTKQGKIITVGE